MGIREVTASINFRSIPTMSLRGPVNPPTDEPRSGEFDGTGGTGGTEYQKCPLIFFILRGYIDYIYVYLYTK